MIRSDSGRFAMLNFVPEFLKCNTLRIRDGPREKLNLYIGADMRKQWSEEEKQEIVEACNSAKENGTTVRDVLEYYDARSSQLCLWRKEYAAKTEKPDYPVEIMQEFGVDPAGDEIEIEVDEETEAGRLSIQNENHRECTIIALVVAGYRVWIEVENGNYFIYYE